jgi:hypothetical protein
LVAAALVAAGGVFSIGFVGLLLAVNDKYRAALARRSPNSPPFSHLLPDLRSDRSRGP